MKPHGIKFNDQDWETVKALAERLHITPASFVNLACKMLVEKMGEQWQGRKLWGRPRKDAQEQLERYEIELLQLPPLADWDEDDE